MRKKDTKKERKNEKRKAPNRNKYQFKECSRVPADRRAYDLKEENNFKMFDADYQCMM